jgi:hypothetical protein
MHLHDSTRSSHNWWAKKARVFVIANKFAVFAIHKVILPKILQNRKRVFTTVSLKSKDIVGKEGYGSELLQSFCLTEIMR